MAKRLLDALHLLQAARGIGQQHLAIRRAEWERYSAASTLVRAARHQTDRVTVTVGAAWELGKRVAASEQRHDWEQEEVGRRGSTAAGEADSRRDVRGSDWEQGPVVRGRDTYARRPDVESDGREASAGEPRVDVPRPVVGDEGDGTTASRHVNPDVFSTREQEVPAARDEDTAQPDVKLEGLFSSPRVSRMVGRGDEIKNPYVGRQKVSSKPLPEMVAAEEARRRTEARPAAREDADRIQSTRPTSPTRQHDDETQVLAASIAEEAQFSSPTPAAVFESAEPKAKSYEMRESRVPSSRFGRLWQYGGLATSMAFGAVGESFRRLGGGGGDEGSLMLSEGNMNRLVAKLSRMRGAALKLGQMMSFQDSKLLPPTINAVLQRVQDSADYMPTSQRDKVLRQNLGDDWRSLFSSFDDKPFAAASIGQVHKATLASNGKDVAVKVQYPGVRNSIDSDLNNLSLLLTASRLLPKGLYLDKTIANARVELGWECDYEREAQACIRFAELTRDDRDAFAVPEIYLEASGPGVLTAEFMHGTAVTKIPDLTQDDRDWVGTQILRLCLRELMEWRFMQTDPNWTNFLYNRRARHLELLDFGASREFPRSFTDPYIRLLLAASHGDRAQCAALSVQLGYLTGHESGAMRDAHVASVLTLAEPFVDDAPAVYDFRDQTITDRVRANIGLMLRERQAPPPEETYSLHRKLSGAFLLCARLRSRVPAQELFRNAIQRWEDGERVAAAEG